MGASISKPHQKTRQVLSLSIGNLIQVVGIGAGEVLLWLISQPISNIARVASMIGGYLTIYFTTHSLSHYLVGRLVGIKFTHYSVGGSTHAASYPSVMRQVFGRLPFFAAHTDPQSMRSAGPAGKASMFGADIASTVLFCSLYSLLAYLTKTPGALIPLVFNGIWQISSVIAEIRYNGDIAKAAKALRP